VWFLAPLIVALFGSHPEPVPEPQPLAEEVRLVPAVA
jgi:hypothetical protein